MRFPSRVQLVAASNPCFVRVPGRSIEGCDYSREVISVARSGNSSEATQEWALIAESPQGTCHGQPSNSIAPTNRCADPRHHCPGSEPGLRHVVVVVGIAGSPTEGRVRQRVGVVRGECVRHRVVNPLLQAAEAGERRALVWSSQTPLLPRGHRQIGLRCRYPSPLRRSRPRLLHRSPEGRVVQAAARKTRGSGEAGDRADGLWCQIMHCVARDSRPRATLLPDVPASTDVPKAKAGQRARARSRGSQPRAVEVTLCSGGTRRRWVKIIESFRLVPDMYGCSAVQGSPWIESIGSGSCIGTINPMCLPTSCVAWAVTTRSRRPPMCL